jgi:hypothetical protein
MSPYKMLRTLQGIVALAGLGGLGELWQEGWRTGGRCRERMPLITLLPPPSTSFADRSVMLMARHLANFRNRRMNSIKHNTGNINSNTR